jgi:ABC-2 type transport system ATP-binding protein
MRKDPMAVHARGLRKRFGQEVALAGIDLDIPEGSVVLMVGPNGAGKTTLLRVLLDLLPADAGEVQVLGRSPGHEGPWIRADAGLLPESIHFPFGGMKVEQVLGFHARFRPRWDTGYARRLADALDLRLDRAWKQLSKGEARRAQIVTALAHRPRLLLLDEPTDGLDPVIRERVLSLLAEHLAETGATTLYCTHVLHEAQTLADRLLVLRSGEVRLDRAIDELRRTHRRVRVRVGAQASAAPARPDFVVREEGRTERELRWIVDAPEAELRAWSDQAGVQIEQTEAVSVADTALAYLVGGTTP